MDVSKFRSDVRIATGLGDKDKKKREIRKADEQRGGTFDTCGTIANVHKTCHKASTKKITWET
jgi:hypothetical protein